MKPEINFAAFADIMLCAGTIVQVESFAQARRPAYIVHVDFGADIGVKKTSAQITALYDEESLIGRQIIGLVNIPPRQIGPIMSEFLLTGFSDEKGDIVLSALERTVPNGAQLH